MSKNKVKWLKRATRREDINMRKGGYHNPKKRTIKEQKDIDERLDEASVTAGIKGYLSNMKQSVSGDRGKTPWYLDKDQELAHSLQESLEISALVNLINEIGPKTPFEKEEGFLTPELKIKQAQEEEERRKKAFEKFREKGGQVKKVKKDPQLPGKRSEKTRKRKREERPERKKISKLSTSQRVKQRREKKPIPYKPSKERKETIKRRFKGKQYPMRGAAVGKGEKGRVLKFTPEEVEDIKDVEDLSRRLGRKPKHRKGLGTRGFVKTAKGLGGKSQELIDSFVLKLNLEKDSLLSKGFDPRGLPQKAQNVIKAADILPKMSNFFWKTHLTSYPMYKKGTKDPGMVSQAQEFAKEKSGREFDIKLGPGSDQVIHLVAEKAPLDLILKFAEYYQQNPKEVKRSEIRLRQAVTKAGRHGEKGLVTGDPSSKIRGPKVSRELEDEADTEIAGSEISQDLWDYIDQLVGIDKAEEEGFAGEEGPSEEKVESKKEVTPEIYKTLEVAKNNLEKQGKRIEDITMEDLKSVIPRRKLFSIISGTTLDPEGVFRQKAVRAISKSLGLDSPDLVEQALEDMVTSRRSSERGREELYKTVSDPRHMSKPPSMSEEQWQERLPVYRKLYNVFAPERILKRGAKDLDSPFVEFFKDKLEQFERGRAEPRIRAGEEALRRKQKAEIRRKRKEPPQRVPGARSRYVGKLTTKGEEPTKWSPYDPSVPETVSSKKEFEKALQKQQQEERRKKIISSLEALRSKEDAYRNAAEEIRREIESFGVRDEEGKLRIPKLGRESSKRIRQKKAKFAKIKDKLKQIADEIKKREAAVTTEGLKRHLKKKLFEDFDFETLSLVEMFLSAESSKKEEKVDKKKKAWEKAKPTKKKDFYPKLEEVFGAKK